MPIRPTSALHKLSNFSPHLSWIDVLHPPYQNTANVDATSRSYRIRVAVIQGTVCLCLTVLPWWQSPCLWVVSAAHSPWRWISNFSWGPVGTPGYFWSPSHQRPFPFPPLSPTEMPWWFISTSSYLALIEISPHLVVLGLLSLGLALPSSLLSLLLWENSRMFKIYFSNLA